MDYLEANIIHARISTDENWLYIIVDQNKRQIVYMGTTEIHPVAQIEKLITDGTYETNENSALKLYAFPIPTTKNRELIKKMVVNELEQLNVDIREEFEGATLDAEIWKEHVDFSKKIIANINMIQFG
ncbi:hypothetical protein [Oceanobacillus bengalensis]|uniref:Uncharacterized protein n=1 Tax=Oceanobacillus bengalensis TaxID=1435466 RepID=A0A494Z5K3_9BACI|nr:hypothetical protein [Oceanobacillus bengalensis]RKQ17596.1 hypothetical protein D8M05_04140 [Oceanobacillus bengalensis]